MPFPWRQTRNCILSVPSILCHSLPSRSDPVIPFPRHSLPLDPEETMTRTSLTGIYIVVGSKVIFEILKKVWKKFSLGIWSCFQWKRFFDFKQSHFHWFSMETVLSFFFSFEKIICSENQCKSKMFFQKRNWVPRNCSNSFVFGVESSYFEMLQVWSWNARIWDVSLYIFVYGGPHHPFDGENIRPVWIQNKNNNNPEVTTDGGSLLTWHIYQWSGQPLPRTIL